jgi:hypothetical protein
MYKKTILITLLAFALLLFSGACSSTGSQLGPSTGSDGGADGENGLPAADGELLAPFQGIAAIELLTPATGAGEKPLFEWTPVEGAARYSLILQFPDGRPYWAWSGDANSVYLGGLDTAPPADAAGPILLEGMTWAVFAFDAEGNMIGSSAVQAISP